jgi:GMP synthase-like glutamine amidotransferase
VLDGEFPASPKDADLWVITGSRFGVYEDHPWIPPLEDFIRACATSGVKMFGICFGHQIIAQAMGGEVRKSDKGWGVGIHDYRVEEWPGAPEHRPQALDIQAYHQDQVIVPPPGARRIAASDFCPNAGLWYPGFAISVQGHPEFPADYAEALIKARRSTSLGAQVADKALATVHNPSNAEVLAQLVSDFLDAPKAETAEPVGGKAAD